MLNRVMAPVAALFLSLSFSSLAMAGERMAFDAAAFADAQKAGKSIIVHVTAPWCPTCEKQKPIVDSAAAKYEGTLVLDVDFDTSKDTLRTLDARKQSTLIAFKGETETGRSAGDTKAEGIEALVKSAQ
jgi:thioredoxin 1